ncbi:MULTISPECIES: hypothetical protein [Halorussus]|uniref:hypothetical protein n=1 Tax=Halorussus TaxID=1070314 RepID=UPI00209FF9E0|nr:hypothetical protein [Halorussus vallis]USZ75666.1 hypothetical protein NGM07_19835 [Halorussus vallis]USZ75721.1 hypothetical protein NGM07_20115 [Halorussus vallis]USZ75739.1 hypothetical protein NGM07_00060 [Halorussus vallis]
MPLRTETIEFAEEIQRLEDEREELAEQLADLDDDNPVVPELAQRGHEIDTHLKGLRWARDEAHTDTVISNWTTPAEHVTLAGLTGGEFGAVEDTLVSEAAARGQSSPGDGATRVHLVAKGTVDAPYLPDEDDEKKTVAAVAQLPIPFLKWAEARVDELTSVGEEEGNSFGRLVAEKRAKKTSTDK